MVRSPLLRLGAAGAAETAIRDPAKQERQVFVIFTTWGGPSNLTVGLADQGFESNPVSGAMPFIRSSSRGATLRAGAITAIAAVVLQFGLMAGIDHSAAAQFSIGFRVLSIPSTSMAPTLQINEYVLALEWSKVSRGDVVAYLLPK